MTLFSTRQRRTAWLIALGVAAAVGAAALASERRYHASVNELEETRSVEQAVRQAVALLKDAETGQRGFVLTGDEAFLAPYLRAHGALRAKLDALSELVYDNPPQAKSARELRWLADAKMIELAETVELRREGRTDEALDIVREGSGRRSMAAIGEETERMLKREERRRSEQVEIVRAGRSRLTLLLGAVWGSFLLVVAGGFWSAMRGVAEARRVAERIAESEKTLRRVADNATDLVRIIDDHANTVYVSPSCKRILGFSETEMLATSPRGLLPEEERESALELTRRIKAKELETAVFSHRLRTKSGGYRWFETTLGLVQSGLDQIPHVHLTSRDISERRAAEQALQHQTARLESILSSMGDGVAVFDENRQMLIVNPAAQDYLRYEQGQALAADWPARHRACEIDGETPFPAEQGPLTRALRGEACSVQLVMHDKLDQPRAFSVTASPILEGEGQLTGCVAVYRDITEQRKAARDLAESEERSRLLSEASFEGVVLSKAGVIVDINENFASWLDRSRAELIGSAGLTYFAPEHHDEVKLKSALSDVRYEADMLRRDGTRLPVEVRGRALKYRGEPMRIAVIRDMTERRLREAELKEHAEKLRRLSLRDELTGLYNRRGFLEHAQQALRNATRSKRPGCVFFADLNGMKAINDTLGHEMGDRAIVATSRVLTTVFRDADIVARLGGDEFAIFASECRAADVGSIAARLSEEVAAWNRKGTEGFELSLSIGSGIFEPSAPLDLAELMEQADREMYEQKRARRKLSSRVLSA